MNSIIDYQGHYFSKDRAEELAAILNEDFQDDWKYVVKHPPDGVGFSLVEIFDLEGNFVGRL